MFFMSSAAARRRRTARRPASSGTRVARKLTIAAAVAEAHRADLAGAVRTRAQVVRRGDEVFARLGLIELREPVARLVFVARVAAERRQRIGRERHEVVERQAARDVFDVRVEAAVLVHHEDAGQLAGGVGRAAPDTP